MASRFIWQFSKGCENTYNSDRSSKATDVRIDRRMGTSAEPYK